MYRQIVITVGTSLFAPFNELGALLRQSKVFELNSRGLEKVKAGNSESEAIVQWLQQVAQALEGKQLKTVPFSAEISAMQALSKHHKIDDPVEIHLFYTDTLEGRVISRTLQQVVKQLLQVQVNLHAIRAFDVKHVEQTNEAMGHFLIALCKILQSHRQKTAFIPIGGYKVITTTAYMAGAITQTNTYYIPEGGDELHALPLLPVTFSSNLAVLKLLQIIYEKKRVSIQQLSLQDRQLLADHPNFTIQQDNVLSINALGYYLLHVKGVMAHE